MKSVGKFFRGFRMKFGWITDPEFFSKASLHEIFSIVITTSKKGYAITFVSFGKLFSTGWVRL